MFTESLVLEKSQAISVSLSSQLSFSRSFLFLLFFVVTSYCHLLLFCFYYLVCFANCGSQYAIGFSKAVRSHNTSVHSPNFSWFRF